MSENDNLIPQSGVTEEVKITSDTEESVNGKVQISDEVIAQVAISALSAVPGVSHAAPSLMSNLRIGRRVCNGIRISTGDDETTGLSIDLFVTVKYGLRIPDLCWDVQEAVKDKVEQLTGYLIKDVNVYVQGIDFPDEKEIDVSSEILKNETKEAAVADEEKK